MNEPRKEYQAFISYKHSVSSRLAIALEAALRRYAKPIFKPPIRLFRDEDQMSAGIDLKASIRSALERSEYLIYIACREAAQSPYVQEELEIWCNELGRQEQLIIVWQKDGLQDDPEHNSVSWDDSDALPATLAPHIRGIPIWLDFTWVETADDLDLRNPRFKALINSITARFRGIAPEVLTGVEIRTHRRNIRIRNSAVVVLAALIVVSLVALARMLTEREQARINLLTYQSSQMLGSDTTLALRLAYEAYARSQPDPSAQIRQLLMEAFYLEDPEKTWRYSAKFSHGGGLKDAILSPDGSKVATAGFNGFLYVWSTDGRRLGAVSTGQQIEQLQFSGDGSLVLTTGYLDPRITVWQTDGTPYDAIEVKPSERPYAEFQPNGRKVLILSNDVTIWEPGGKTIVLDEANVRWARFTPDGSQVVTCQSGIREGRSAAGRSYRSSGMLRRWTADGRYKGRIPIAGGGKEIVLSSDGSYLLTLQRHGNIALWDRGGEEVAVCDGNGRHPASVSVAPDGNHFAVVFQDGTLGLWHRSGASVRDSWKSGGGIQACSFSADSRFLLTRSTDHVIRILDLAGRVTGIFGGAPQTFTSARFSPIGGSILTASTDGTARLWQPPGRDAVTSFTTGTDHMVQMEFFADGKRLAILSGEGRIRVFNLLGEPLDCALGRESDVGMLHMDPLGRLVVTAGLEPGTLKLWRQDEGAFLRELVGHRSRVSRVECSADGRYVISESWDGQALIWNREGERFPICQSLADNLRSARFMPGGSKLLALSSEGKLQLVDFDKGIISSEMEKETGVAAFERSPQGRFIRCTFDDGSFMMFDRLGRKVLARQEHGSVTTVGFLPDESGYIEARGSGHIRIMDMEGGLRGEWDYPSESRFHGFHFAPDAGIVFIPQSGEIHAADGSLMGTMPDYLEAFFPDSPFMLTCTRERQATIRIRDLNGRAVVSWGAVRRTVPHPSTPRAAFTSDGRRFAVASEDGRITIGRTDAGIFTYLHAIDWYELTAADYANYGIEWMQP